MSRFGFIFLAVFWSTPSWAQTLGQVGNSIRLQWTHNRSDTMFQIESLKVWPQFKSTFQLLETLAPALDGHAGLAQARLASHCRIELVVDVLGSPIDRAGWVKYQSRWQKSGYNSTQHRPVHYAEVVSEYALGPVSEGEILEKAEFLQALDGFLVRAAERSLDCDPPAEVALPVTTSCTIKPQITSDPVTPLPTTASKSTAPALGQIKSKKGAPKKLVSKQTPKLNASQILQKIGNCQTLSSEELSFIQGPNIYVQFEGCEDRFQDLSAAEQELNKMLAYLRYAPTARVVIHGWLNGEDGGMIQGSSAQALDQPVGCGPGSSFTGRKVSKLMMARAQVVRDWLISKGIAASRVEATTGEVGMGELARKVTVEYKK